MVLKDIHVRNAKPKAKIYRLFDGGGLYLEISPGGGKYWRYKYRFAGKEKRLAFGTYPDLSLSEAREVHAQARKALAKGEDPSAVKREAARQIKLKSTNTFEAIAREWHQNNLAKWTPTHGAKVLRRLEVDIFQSLGSRPIAEIPSSEMLEAIRKIEKRGAYDIAHRVLQSCGQIFAYAIITDRAKSNPTTALRGALKPVQKNHRAYLKANDLPEFLSKLENYDGDLQTQLAVRLLLLTFVRTGELRGAKWEEINFDASEWRIPAERMKMRDPHIVPLSTQAIFVLRKMQSRTSNNEYVFPNQQKPTGFMSENTILYALYRMGYHSRATGHGFRATASTILNEHGFHSDVIERQLAHVERNKVRAAYNHAEYLPERRKMMQWWGDHLYGLVLKGRQS
jgi:integrase